MMAFCKYFSSHFFQILLSQIWSIMFLNTTSSIPKHCNLCSYYECVMSSTNVCSYYITRTHTIHRHCRPCMHIANWYIYDPCNVWHNFFFQGQTNDCHGPLFAMLNIDIKFAIFHIEVNFGNGLSWKSMNLPFYNKLETKNF